MPECGGQSLIRQWHAGPFCEPPSPFQSGGKNGGKTGKRLLVTASSSTRARAKIGDSKLDFEIKYRVAEVHGSRTHPRPGSWPSNRFEDGEAHRDPSTSQVHGSL